MKVDGHAGDQHNRRAQAGPRRHTNKARRRQWVPEQALVCGARNGQGRPHQPGQGYAGEPDLPYDGLPSIGPPSGNVDEGQSAGHDLGDRPGRYVDGAHAARDGSYHHHQR